MPATGREPDPHAAARGGVTEQRYRILVVEDEGLLAASLVEDLDQLGPGETPALLHDPHAHKLARDTERDEDNPFGLP